MSQGTGPTGPNRKIEAEPTKAKAEREIRGDHILQYSMLRDYVVELQSTNPNTTFKIGVERNTDPSLPTRVFKRIYVCLGLLKLGFKACRIYLLGLDGVFMKGPFPGQVLAVVGLDSNNGIYPLAYALVEAEKHRYCLQHIHENMKQGWCGQAYKDLLWRAASATSVKEFEKCMLELKTMNPKAHEWLNKIPTEHWARSYFSGRAKSDLLLNNICEVFNGKIVGGRDKPVITLLEYIREYYMKRIVNVQSVIEKCTGPLTPTATKIMESIKKEAHLMKVQWNGENKYQVSGSLGDHLLEYDSECPGGTTPRSVGKSLLLVDYMEGNILSQGRPRKKRKRSKHEDKPFVKDSKLSRKGRIITCQSCGNTGHNKATFQGQGGNDAEVSGSASRQAQQIEHAVGQDGSGGSGVGVVIGFSAAIGQGGLGVDSQGLSHTRWTKKINEDGREMGDGIPTKSSAGGGASEWFLRGDGVAGIKRRRRDLYGDGVRNLATASGHGRLKEDLESSTWRRRQDF
ncbi:hypothetical protein Tco_1094115 [Tanacetum coccineum]|uniref:MULE transposase domain-containing protein n=1 Tax=Tanacetum coccineum TaxID=301880 RepID=A0ABQ5IEM2_9ASTR